MKSLAPSTSGSQGIRNFLVEASNNFAKSQQLKGMDQWLGTFAWRDTPGGSAGSGGVAPAARGCRVRSSAPKFADIYSKYFSFVWSMVRYLGVEAAALDDVVQDIFVVIHGRLCTLQRPESLRSWIYGITRRVVSTHHRLQRSARITGMQPFEPELTLTEQPTPEQLAEQSEEAKLLWSLVSTLDAPKREVFVLAELEEMSAPEIAALTKVPLNTVYSRLRVAHRELEEALKRHNARTQMRSRLARSECRDYRTPSGNQEGRRLIPCARSACADVERT